MKMKQWICPGITRKEYLNICGRSLALGMWVVEYINGGGLPVFEPDAEMAKGYRLPRQYQSKDEAIALARELLLDHGYNEDDISISFEKDYIWIEGTKLNSDDEEMGPDVDAEMFRAFCISEQSRDNILEVIRLDLGL